jgi:hypothetical protein
MRYNYSMGSGGGLPLPAGRLPGSGCLGGLPCPLPRPPLPLSLPSPPAFAAGWSFAFTAPRGRCGLGAPCAAVTVPRQLAFSCPPLRKAPPCASGLVRRSCGIAPPSARAGSAPFGALARWRLPRRPGRARCGCPTVFPPLPAAPPWRTLPWPWRCKAPSGYFAPGLPGAFTWGLPCLI